MRHIPAHVLTAALALLSTPVLAETNCHSVGNGPDIGLEFHFGEAYTEEERAEFAKMELRRQGVNASRVELWGGCYRAFVNDGNGTRMEYFNSRTLEPVGSGNGLSLTLSP